MEKFPYLLFLRFNDLDGLAQNGAHVDELVPDLLGGHALQGGSLGSVLALRLGQIHAEVHAAVAVIHSDLHVIVAHTVHQQTLQMEG